MSAHQFADEESSAAQQVAPPTNKNKFKFFRSKDSSGHPIRGIWERNGRFYASMDFPGQGTRRIPLRNESNTPVRSVAEAVKARSRLVLDRDKGRTPKPCITPHFNKYVTHYINWLESTHAKSPLTLDKERSSLNGWARFLGDLRLSQISRKNINAYIQQRTEGDDGVGARTANLDVIALGNLLKFARDEEYLRGDLPTEHWTALKYTAPRRSLVTWDEIEKLVTEAARKVEGIPKYRNGQLLADFLKLLAFSGARRQAALSLAWRNVDWANRQVTFFTKFDRIVTVDFNANLENHLKDLRARRNPNSQWVFPSPTGAGYCVSPQGTFQAVREACGMLNFRFHDLRSYFASYCIFSGIDTMTIAAWLGHRDGGVLIGKIYGFLNQQHRRDAAAKVTFTQPATAASDAVQSGWDLTKISTAELLAALQQRVGPVGQ